MKVKAILSLLDAASNWLKAGDTERSERAIRNARRLLAEYQAEHASEIALGIAATQFADAIEGMML